MPKERLGFKLRGGIDKQVTINVQQVTNNAQPSAPADGDDPQVILAFGYATQYISGAMPLLRTKYRTFV